VEVPGGRQEHQGRTNVQHKDANHLAVLRAEDVAILVQAQARIDRYEPAERHTRLEEGIVGGIAHQAAERRDDDGRDVEHDDDLRERARDVKEPTDAEHDAAHEAHDVVHLELVVAVAQAFIAFGVHQKPGDGTADGGESA